MEKGLGPVGPDRLAASAECKFFDGSMLTVMFRVILDFDIRLLRLISKFDTIPCTHVKAAANAERDLL